MSDAVWAAAWLRPRKRGRDRRSQHHGAGSILGRLARPSTAGLRQRSRARANRFRVRPPQRQTDRRRHGAWQPCFDRRDAQARNAGPSQSALGAAVDAGRGRAEPPHGTLRELESALERRDVALADAELVSIGVSHDDPSIAGRAENRLLRQPAGAQGFHAARLGLDVVAEQIQVHPVLALFWLRDFLQDQLGTPAGWVGQGEIRRAIRVGVVTERLRPERRQAMRIGAVEGDDKREAHKAQAYRAAAYNRDICEWQWAVTSARTSPTRLSIICVGLGPTSNSTGLSTTSPWTGSTLVERWGSGWRPEPASKVSCSAGRGPVSPSPRTRWRGSAPPCVRMPRRPRVRAPGTTPMCWP